MRLSTLYSTIFSVCSAVATIPEGSSFLQPVFAVSYEDVFQVLNDLGKRQNNCPVGANSCSNLGDAGACCTSNTNCQLDQAGRVACCPIGALCTGTINVGINTAGSSQTTATSSNVFIVPTSTTAGNPQVTGASTIQNAFFPFVAVPATYSNAAACSAYYSSCQGQYNLCTASLGGVNGVTVSGAGVGITVPGATPTVQAQSICSSLSSQACSALQLGNCNTFGTAAAPTATLINPNAAPTRCPGGVYMAGIGVALGVAGQVLV
ncbi:hypothetical protein MMC16_006513 [Acarospora aff. strigata]|nr:hypothetical protein [Acarospora aff. strigata]